MRPELCNMVSMTSEPDAIRTAFVRNCEFFHATAEDIELVSCKPTRRGIPGKTDFQLLAKSYRGRKVIDLFTGGFYYRPEWEIPFHELKTGELFQFRERRGVYESRGNGWYGTPEGFDGGPWHTYGVDDSGEPLTVFLETPRAV